MIIFLLFPALVIPLLGIGITGAALAAAIAAFLSDS